MQGERQSYLMQIVDADQLDEHGYLRDSNVSSTPINISNTGSVMKLT